MKTKYLLFSFFFLIVIYGCATGGKVGGDGTATGGTVEVGDIDVSPCVNLTGSTSTGDCKKKN